MRSCGTLIDHVKQGTSPAARHHNPYIQKALSLEGALHTERDWNQHTQPPGTNFGKRFLEIGCYTGKNTAELARLNPDAYIVGLDITYKRAVKSAEKLQAEQLTNGSIVLCDGQRFLETCIPSAFFQGVCLFFPDPWPKGKQQKHRIIKADFLRALQKSLVPGGFFWLKTDAQDYFQQAQTLLLEHGFTEDTAAKDREGCPVGLALSAYQTLFQELFARKNIPFSQGVFLTPTLE